MYDDHTLLFPMIERRETENIIPIAVFLARKIAVLKRSFATSNDGDERNEILATLMFHQSALLLLSLSFLTEETDLTDLAKEIYRN